MKKFSFYIIAGLLTFAVGVGCTKTTDEPAAATPAVENSAAIETEADSSLVTRAHALAKLRDAIKANPENVDALLTEANFTDEDLDELLFAIAQDPDASAAYAAAH
ncbi:MAG: hypothetical protein H0U74_03730 [Bradymonadaceae bacterium]|nr:hypothetical protein [Lujinxingiaceae bacterium]